jgi:tryptophan halogenase
MKTPVRHVLVLGGGSAGWLTAAILAKKFNNNIKVTLVESPEISSIGVGEGTWPTMRATLKNIGIDENEFFRECHASFKQGSHFSGWHDAQDNYYHPFTQPRGYPQFDLSPYWLNDQGKDFASSVCFQPELCKQHIAPKAITDKQYQGAANYGYHLDAGKFAQLLKKHVVNKLHVNHVSGTVKQVELTAQGAISRLMLTQGEALTADFFVDCSGFSSLLLGKALNIPFIEKNDVLLADKALAVQIPYQNANDPVNAYTRSTAQSAGWIWDIGLTDRRGVGYVYSSKHSSKQQAHDTLASYLNLTAEQFSPREISFTAGHRAKFWHKNCVAIGLSAGFLEPLEASALMLIETSADYIANQLPPCQSLFPLVEQRFNQEFLYRWQKIIEFLKLHYLLSKRQEPFWQASRASESIPENLSQLLQLWQYRPPAKEDFLSNFEVFPAASYLYILYGMKFNTDLSHSAHLLEQPEQARQLLLQNQKAAEQAMQRLPDHRTLLNQLQQHSFQKI